MLAFPLQALSAKFPYKFYYPHLSSFLCSKASSPGCKWHLTRSCWCLLLFHFQKGSGFGTDLLCRRSQVSLPASPLSPGHPEEVEGLEK